MRRGESKRKGPEVRAWPLVGGAGRRQEWPGREEQEREALRERRLCLSCAWWVVDVQ